jgi:ABC-type branched-subunit amino acid transport system substrate-binding protein
MTIDNKNGISRRKVLTVGAGLAGGAMINGGLTMPVFAAGEAPIGTWPEGSKGNSVTVSIAVPRTGTYAVQGEDELKGWQLAVEHMNSGHELMKKFSPKTTKGVLGK